MCLAFKDPTLKISERKEQREGRRRERGRGREEDKLFAPMSQTQSEISSIEEVGKTCLLARPSGPLLASSVNLQPEAKTLSEGLIFLKYVLYPHIKPCNQIQGL